MRTEGFRHSLISISLIFALVLSIAFISTPVRVAALTNPPPQQWDVLITATFQEGSDDAIFGVRPDATAGFDSAYDLPEPPPPVEPPYVQAFFHYPGNAPLPTRLHRSCIPPENIMEWPLSVSYRNGTDNITLSWSLENVPADYAVLLFKGEDLVADMRAVDNYTFQTAGSDFDFTIRVAVAAVWRLIETWTGTAQAPAEWQLVKTWTGTVEAPAEWQLVETWTGTVHVPSPWHLIEAWTRAIEAPAQWQPIETWTGTIRTIGWELIETWTGTVKALVPVLPAAPSLISPADRTITDDNTPTFDWSDVAGAKNYDLLVDDDADFSSPEIQVTVSASTYTIPDENSLPDDSYSWKVRARDAANNVGDWSSTWTLLVSVARGVNVFISPSYQSGLPGATLSYSVTVKNEWNISDTFALTVADSAGWVPTLSKDSLALAPKAYDTVTLAVTIPTDASVGDQYNITITAKSTVDPTVSDSARCTAQATAIRRRVEVSISPDTKSGPPGETLTYTATIVNEGDAEDTYDLTVTDALAWGASVSPNSLTIAAGGSDTATVSVVIPAGTASGIEDEITVTATSRADLTVGDSATCIASAAAVMGVKVSISPETKSGPSEEMLTYEVTVKNEGNVGDTYILSTAGAPDWSPRVENTSLTLNAGEVGETTLTVTIPPGASEGTSKTVTVTAISVGDPTVVGSVTCRATVKGVPEKPEELLIPLAISAFLIGAAILTTADLLRVRSRKAARRRVLRGPRRF